MIFEDTLISEKLHAVSSYKKLCKIHTSPVSYFLSVFIQTLFLIFFILYSLCFLNFVTIDSCFLRLWLISYNLDKNIQAKIASPMKQLI